MKQLLYYCSLTFLIIFAACDKHSDIVIPNPPECEFVSFIQTDINCPTHVGGSIEVWFEARFACVDFPGVVVNITNNGHSATYVVVQQQTQGTTTTVWYKSTIVPAPNSQTATLQYSITFNGVQKHFTISCDLPDEPVECYVEDVKLVNKICPDHVGESMEVWFDVIYNCATLPPLNLTFDDNGHFVTYEQTNPTQQGGKWIRHVHATIMPSASASYVEVTYTVSFGGSSQHLTVSCDLPDPEQCSLQEIKIIDEEWLSEEKVKLSLEVWFKDCTTAPNFDVSVNTDALDVTVVHTGSYTQGGYLKFKITSVVTAVKCAPSVYANYTVNYQGNIRTVGFSALLCEFIEARNEGQTCPYQNSNNKAGLVFELLFENCHADPVFTVDFNNNDITNAQISLDVVNVTQQGNIKIFKMFSLIESTQSLLGRWITYQIDYCGDGVYITFDF